MWKESEKKDEALDWLEIAYKEQDPNFSYICVDPIFDYLRDDPRFMRLMGYLNLPQGR